MNAIDRPRAIHNHAPAVARSDARAELAHHAFDLRVHSLFNLFGAALVMYCGFRILDVDDTGVSGEPGRAAMQPNLLSYCALAIFVAIAAFCLFEACRSWRSRGSDDHVQRR